MVQDDEHEDEVIDLSEWDEMVMVGYRQVQDDEQVLDEHDEMENEDDKRVSIVYVNLYQV